MNKSAMHELLELLPLKRVMNDPIYKQKITNLLEKEKHQIIDAYRQGHEDGYHFEGSQSDYEAEGLEKYLSEQYYNDNFKED